MPRTPPDSMACEATTLLMHTVTKKAPMVSQSRFHQTDSASLLLYVFSFMGLPDRNGYGGRPRATLETWAREPVPSGAAALRQKNEAPGGAAGPAAERSRFARGGS